MKKLTKIFFVNFKELMILHLDSTSFAAFQGTATLLNIINLPLYSFKFPKSPKNLTENWAENFLKMSHKLNMGETVFIVLLF